MRGVERQSLCGGAPYKPASSQGVVGKGTGRWQLGRGDSLQDQQDHRHQISLWMTTLCQGPPAPRPGPVPDPSDHLFSCR